MMNTREARALAAVQKLGCPSTLDVAEECGLSTTEARVILNDLEDRGVIVAQGRRWTVPSVALAQGHAPTGEVEVKEPGIGCAAAICVIVIALAILLGAVVFAINGAFNG